MIVLRAALVVLAAAAVVWLAVALQASRAQDELARLVAAPDPPAAADLDRARELRRDAERGVPGRRPALLEATLLVQAGDHSAAINVLRETVEDEPENGEAWLLLARAAETGDQDALAARARERVRALAPEVPLP